jgi:uncharacterized membrane protein YjgN (DUF898 family)
MEGQPNTSQRFVFQGRDGEFFKIWIVNVLLSIATLGIYSAWAKVRVERYFYGNTFFDGSNFEYHATGWQIFKGRVIAIIALMIYVIISNIHLESSLIVLALLVLATPWILWSSYRFKARVSSYRGVRFTFTGTLKRAYWIVLIIPFAPAIILGGLAYVSYEFFDLPVVAAICGTIAALSFYFVIPYVQARIHEYHANEMCYGQGRFSTEISTWFFYKTYLWILVAGFGLAFAILGVLAIVGSGSVLIAIMNQDFQALSGLIMVLAGAMAYFGLFAFSFWAKAFMEARISNHVLDHLTLDNAVTFNSTLRTMPLTGLLLTNWLIIMFTCGLGYPIAAIRLAQYRAKSFEGTIHQDLNHYVTQQQQKQSALGEELGGVFDVQGDLGLSL